MNDMLRRQNATKLTLEKYRSRKFSWAKRSTCVHLVRFHLRMMGHKLPSIPDLRSAIGAKRALTERGWANAGEMMDALLPVIAPAEALLGDVVMLDDDSGLGGLGVSTGHKFLGWHEDAPRMVVIEPHIIARAWRA